MLDEETEKKALVELITFIMLIAPASLLVSYIYNYGYFYQLNIGINKIPLSLQDHILTASQWAPYVIAIIIFTIMFEFLSKRIERYQTEDELTKGHPGIKKFRESEKFILPIVTAVLIISFILFGRRNGIQISFLGFFILIMFNIWLATHINYFKRVTSIMRLMVLIIPILFVYSFASGMDSAHKDYMTSDTVIKYQNMGKKILLRSFDKFQLVKSDSDSLQALINEGHIIIFGKKYSFYNGLLPGVSGYSNKYESN